MKSVGGTGTANLVAAYGPERNYVIRSLREFVMVSFGVDPVTKGEK